MIYSTKRGQCWSFWCKGWSNHQDQEVFWWNRTFETAEASEVSEVDEFNEVAEVLRLEKSLESWIQLNFDVIFFFNYLGKVILNFRLFLSEGVEASQCYFFEKWLIKPKCHYLLNMQLEIWNRKSQNFYLSEPIYFIHFNVRHPVRW